MRVSLSRAWEESRGIFARDGGLLSAVALALLVLPQIVAGLAMPANESDPSLGARLIALAGALIGVVGQLAIVRLALGPSTTVGQAIRHGASRFPALIGALMLLVLALAAIFIPLMAVLLAAGLVEVPATGQQPDASFALVAFLLLIACLLIAVRFMLTVPVASAEKVGPIGVIKRSWRLTAGRFWPLLGLELLLLVAAVFLLLSAQVVGGTLGAIAGDLKPFSLPALIVAMVVGLAQAVFTVLASLMLTRVYVQVAGGGEAQASVPTTGT